MCYTHTKKDFIFLSCLMDRQYFVPLYMWQFCIAYIMLIASFKKVTGLYLFTYTVNSHMEPDFKAVNNCHGFAESLLKNLEVTLRVSCFLAQISSPSLFPCVKQKISSVSVSSTKSQSHSLHSWELCRKGSFSIITNCHM